MHSIFFCRDDRTSIQLPTLVLEHKNAFKVTLTVTFSSGQQYHNPSETCSVTVVPMKEQELSGNSKATLQVCLLCPVSLGPRLPKSHMLLRIHVPWLLPRASWQGSGGVSAESNTEVFLKGICKAG